MKKPTEQPKLYKTCASCSSVFERNKKYSKTQWESSLFCSNECSIKSRDFSYLQTPERRELMRQLQLGKKLSEQTRRKMSLSSPRIRPKGELRGRAWKGGVSLQPKYKQIMWRKRRALQLGSTGSHTENEWEELKSFYKNICLCCKIQEPLIKLTRDHIIPLSKMGDDYITNIQPLCQSCNSRKHTKIINYAVEHLASAIGFELNVPEYEE